MMMGLYHFIPHFETHPNIIQYIDTSIVLSLQPTFFFIIVISQERIGLTPIAGWFISIAGGTPSHHPAIRLGDFP